MILEVDGRRLLIGLGENGPPRLLTELTPSVDDEALCIPQQEGFREDVPPVYQDEEKQLEGHGDGLGA